MGLGQSAEEPTIEQAVVDVGGRPGRERRGSLDSAQECATAVKNPFSLFLDGVTLKPGLSRADSKDGKSRSVPSREPRAKDFDLGFPFTASEIVIVQALRSRSPPGPFAENRPDYSRPDSVPADWEHVGAAELEVGNHHMACIRVKIPHSPGVGSEPPRELLCIHIRPKELEKAELWEQWYYLAFQPHAETSSGYRLQEWEEKMRVGPRVFTVMKIFSSKQDAADTSSCLVCASEQSTTMVLPCRHLCLCAECANVIRLKSRSCPVCRGTILSLLELSSPLERRGTL